MPPLVRKSFALWSVLGSFTNSLGLPLAVTVLLCASRKMLFLAMVKILGNS